MWIMATALLFLAMKLKKLKALKCKLANGLAKLDNAAIFPANLYVAPKDMMQQVMYEIQDEMQAQVEYFKSVGKFIEAQRLNERVNMIWK